MLSDAPVASSGLVDYARTTPPAPPPNPYPTRHTNTLISMHMHTHLSMLKKTNRGEGVEHEEGIAYCTVHQILNCLLWQIDSSWPSLFEVTVVGKEDQLRSCSGDTSTVTEGLICHSLTCVSLSTHSRWKGSHSALVRTDSDFFAFSELMLEPRSGLRPFAYVTNVIQ